MTPEFVISMAQEGIVLTLQTAAPMLGLGLIVGLIVSIFQAVTSIQEMTLTFIPKIIAAFAGLLFFAPWMLEKLMAFTVKIITNIPVYIR